MVVTPAKKRIDIRKEFELFKKQLTQEIAKQLNQFAAKLDLSQKQKVSSMAASKIVPSATKPSSSEDVAIIVGGDGTASIAKPSTSKAIGPASSSKSVAKEVISIDGDKTQSSSSKPSTSTCAVTSVTLVDSKNRKNSTTSPQKNKPGANQSNDGDHAGAKSSEDVDKRVSTGSKRRASEVESDDDSMATVKRQVRVKNPIPADPPKETDKVVVAPTAPKRRQSRADSQPPAEVSQVENSNNPAEVQRNLNGAAKQTSSDDTITESELSQEEVLPQKRKRGIPRRRSPAPSTSSLSEEEEVDQKEDEEAIANKQPRTSTPLKSINNKKPKQVAAPSNQKTDKNPSNGNKTDASSDKKEKTPANKTTGPGSTQKKRKKRKRIVCK